jgi:Nucleotidyltransferase/DNA polymerase involved in DNA repair
MSYAVLEVRSFPLHARLRLEPSSHQATAIYSGSGRRALIAHLNDAAERYGLREGMSAVQALGLCPELRLWTRDDAAESEATSLLLNAAWKLAPRVEATAPGLCTIALDGRELATLREDVRRLLAELPLHGLPLRVGVAPTPGVARFAAFHAEPEMWVEDSFAFLAPLPVHLLGLTESEASLFDSLGLRTMGDLARLPEASLAQRLGERGVRLWALATGKDRQPISTVTPPTRYFAHYDFEHPAETLDPLLFLLRRFIDRLSEQLIQASLVAEIIRLKLRLEDESIVEREFRLPQATARADGLFKVVEQYLSSLQTASAVVGLELELIPTKSATRQEGLFESSLRDPHQFYDTLARAAAILGAERVGTPLRVDSHRPDAVEVGPPPAVISEYRPSPRPIPAGLPLRRFRPEFPTLVELDGERPVYLRCASARVEGSVCDTRGPWRRSGDWWEAERAWSQEEWDVELSSGGVYRLTLRPNGWFLEGVYD